MPASPAVAPSPARPTPARKLALVAFGIALAVALMAIVEGVLALAGAGEAQRYADPFVGFEPGRDLFTLEEGPDGPQWVTSPGKLRFFNPQRFPAEKAPGTYRVFALGGSTTAGRPYDASVAFPAWLERYLAAADPARRWEVINAGGISYASYRIVVLMQELVRYQPDLFVVYTGHNEFLEERTYGELRREAPWRRRLRRAASGLRLYNVAREAASRLRPAAEAPGDMLPGEVETRLEGWTGLDRYHRDPALARSVAEHFAYNLRQMAEIARDHGVDLIFIAPASNLKDFSPFKSEHRPGIGAGERLRFAALLERGRELLAADDHQAALAVLAEARALDPEHAEAAFAAGRADLAGGDFAAARDAFIAAKDLDVAPLRAPEELVAAVREAAQETGAPLIDLPALLADDARARFGHDIPGAEHFLDHVHPDLPVHSLLAERLLALLAGRGVAPAGDAAQRQAIYDRMIASLDREYLAQKDLNLATVLGWAGKFAEAEGALQRAAAVLPESPELALNLGIVHQRLGRFEEAARELARAVELAPEEPRAHFNLGLTLGHLDRLGDGAAALAEAIRLRPAYPEAYYNLGVIERRRGNLDAAAEALKRALELAPDKAETHAALALVRRRQERFAEAEAALARSLELDPARAATRLELGITLAREGRLEDAARELAAAAEADPFDPEAPYNLGLTLSRLGRPDEALAAYRRALAIDPSHPQAHNNLGIALAARAEPDAARRHLEAAVAADPAYADARFNLGVLLDATGQPDQALAEIERAVALAPENPRYHYALALLYQARDRPQDAARHLALAEQNGLSLPP